MTRTFARLLATTTVLGGMLCALLATTASAAEQSASGSFTVNGVTTKVAHAYAKQVPSFFDKGRMDTEIIVTDVPLDAKAQQNAFARMELAKAGKLHAFEMTLNPSGKPISTSWRHNGFKDASPSGLSSDDVFSAKTLNAQLVDASYKAAKPHSFFGSHYTFDISFKADIKR